MKIAGIQKCSMVDYPGLIAAVFFTPGCNWRCFYCHNHALVAGKALNAGWDTTSALDWLDSRRGLLDAVVISGGEPTLQPGLADCIRAVRAKGFLVKLDTNGSRPDVLRKLLEDGLLDYVAMDLKAPLERYEAFCGVPVDHRAIDESIDLIMAHAADYEFRTTVAPQLTHSDILAMAGRICGAQRYVLQQYRRPNGDDADIRLHTAPHPNDWVWAIQERIETLVQYLDTRGFDRPAAQRADSTAA